MKGCGKMAANMDRESISTRIKELDTGVTGAMAYLKTMENL